MKHSMQIDICYEQFIIISQKLLVHIQVDIHFVIFYLKHILQNAL